MSTSHDDNKPGADGADESADTVVDTADTTGGAAAKVEDASEIFLRGTPVPPSSALGGVFSAETFAVAGLLLLAPVVVDSRLFELFGWFVLSGATAVPAGYAPAGGADVAVAGGLSALAVLAGAVSLFRSGAHTRASARWVSAATVLVGALFLLIAVVTYAWLPAQGAELGWFGYQPYSGG
ncbi:hypothetical protein [Nocardiopsis sp. CNR-923]|uniref:hypothetical protein n=1 Tax=Nocardiopsis sp. CNR-923 TaxID=1904965 RepID=UPI0009F8603D|nr:hypothetical protein [Nocardiopsis sp. CNR-923]